MLEISLNNIEKNYGIKNILKNLNLQINRGEKIGVVGKNGSGKTTLFKIIEGTEYVDKGTVFISKNSNIGYLEQIPNYPSEKTTIDILNLAFKRENIMLRELNILEKEISDLKGVKLEKALEKYGELQEKYELIGGYEIQEKFSKVTVGLGISEKMLSSKFNTLSGGEKTTVLLGKILLESPDILLLDEPTNHLDMESIDWLEKFIRDYKGTVISISHDRYFLDKVATKIIEVSNGKAKEFLGNYSYYLKEKERLFEEELRKFKEQEKEIKSMEEAIKRLKDWANRGDNEKFFKRAFNMEKRLEKIEKLEKPTTESNISLKFNVKDRAGKEVIDIKSLSKKFGEKILFENIDLNIKFGEKVCIIGGNGTGKTTILKLILEELNPDEGNIKIGSNVKIGYLEQNVLFKDENKSILDTFRYDHIRSEQEARSILAKFLFYGEDVFKKVKDLSGGERARLRLCQLMYKNVNVLILDEPTNHLDIMSREMLEDTLLEFKGTLLFVSHDRYFINKLANTIYELSKIGLEKYIGNYDYYIGKKLEKNIELENIKEKSKSIKIEKDNKSKKKVNPIKLKLLEEEINVLEERISIMDKELEKYSSDFEKLNKILEEKEKLEKRYEEIIEEWLNTNQ
ncbi:ribosomal protection-like ABC-F family protein [Miniphocaeibacter massiliensis]|uniref:ribosomal protection-like ABC-F family protein n=1 Tax=Miniphocaeibacter massiliensis TaxID=2041841 RepID=UPI000C1C7914|nr:ABC-F type ribosomal protection protein [Miniphocaeibacter massiliensis]